MKPKYAISDAFYYVNISLFSGFSTSQVKQSKHFVIFDNNRKHKIVNNLLLVVLIINVTLNQQLYTEYGKIQKGYSYYDFDADVDLQKLSSWNETNPSFWDNWITWGLWDAMTGDIPQETSRTLSPIYIVKQSDLDGGDNAVADRLLMNAGDVAELRTFYNEAVNVNPLDKNDEEKVVVMFRYATSDYYAAPADIIELKGGFLWSDKHTSGEAYRAWESVFLDFDIIQLSFQRDGDWTVIPVVSSPIDVVNGITPPVDMNDDLEWWKILLGIILLILLTIYENSKKNSEHFALNYSRIAGRLLDLYR